MIEPQIGDILDYGDGYRLQVAAVTREVVTKTDYQPNPSGRHQYRDHEAEETQVWVWGHEPVLAIASGGGTFHTLPIEKLLTFWWDLDRHPQKKPNDCQGDLYPPNNARLIRGGQDIFPNMDKVAEDLTGHLEPEKLKF